MKNETHLTLLAVSSRHVLHVFIIDYTGTLQQNHSNGLDSSPQSEVSQHHKNIQQLEYKGQALAKVGYTDLTSISI